jgi:hypothetical protein
MKSFMGTGSDPLSFGKVGVRSHGRSKGFGI